MTKPFICVLVFGAFVSLLTGTGVGTNDLSSAFGVTCGSTVLTLSKNALLASVCEFLAAVSPGGALKATISGGIAKPADFAGHPYMLMYSMLCACGAAFFCLVIVTWLKLLVSSTHRICGGVMCFALVYGVAGSENWADSQAEFPFVMGGAPNIASCFMSPLLTGVVVAAICGTIRSFVLRSANAVQRAIPTLTIIVAIAFCFGSSFIILYEGAICRLHWDMSRAACVPVWIAVGAGVLSCCLVSHC
ncbi:hypothetical protein GH5_05912 [Leishmania sp. Ghana 2012 LV757]|uniref:hypothetical protein n=1 Tax=Leishmania sp. Ghana 2012 LV757 TaxID=2803181 RepID=UPI001B47891A|nr:hypothetical protein GH5_05912 [Leishmania sp. Ghana 2012 LV757]